MFDDCGELCNPTCNAIPNPELPDMPAHCDVFTEGCLSAGDWAAIGLSFAFVVGIAVAVGVALWKRNLDERTEATRLLVGRTSILSEPLYADVDALN